MRIAEPAHLHFLLWRCRRCFRQFGGRLEYAGVNRCFRCRRQFHFQLRLWLHRLYFGRFHNLPRPRDWNNYRRRYKSFHRRPRYLTHDYLRQMDHGRRFVFRRRRDKSYMFQ